MTGSLTGRRVLLGVTGGIAAYKAALVARLLVSEGATVDPILTRGAQRFVGTATFEGITGRPVRDEVWEDIPGDTHVAVGRAADLALIYPATAHTIAKLANGLADDLLTTTLLAATCPLVVAPAMHTEMWRHAATRANVEVLAGRGVEVLGPADGALMGGDEGPGRVVEPEVALACLRRLADGDVAADPRQGGDPAEHAGQHTDAAADTTEGRGSPEGGNSAEGGRPPERGGSSAGTGRLAGRHIVITAGGTREPLDPVRFLGNRSSGRMGFALAAAAVGEGASVELIAANTQLPTPDGVTRTDVVTADEMRDAVFAALDGADVVIKAAAVADFRPSERAADKLKKDPDSPDAAPTIQLVRTPDILAELGRARGAATRPVLVGFAAETHDVEANARTKLERKGVDLLVVNDVSATDAGFEVETNRVVLLDRDGGRVEVPLAPKAQIAARVVDAVADRLRGAR